MLNVLLSAVLAAVPQVPAAWEAPPKPDPNTILSEARQDTRAGRNEVALAKFLWFHHHALEHNGGQGAVRLSFALAYWFELAQRYPPALDALKKTRDDALREIKAGGGAVAEQFHDFVSINERLGEGSLTARTFVELDKEKPDTALKVFALARPALMRAGEWRLCGKYLRPEDDLQRAVQVYRVGMRYEEQRSAPGVPPFAEKSFTNQVATLVGLLVVNDRQPEAQAIAEKARLELDAPAFRAAIDSALAGKLPAPWP